MHPLVLRPGVAARPLLMCNALFCVQGEAYHSCEANDPVRDPAKLFMIEGITDRPGSASTRVIDFANRLDLIPVSKCIILTADFLQHNTLLRFCLYGYFDNFANGVSTMNHSSLELYYVCVDVKLYL